MRLVDEATNRKSVIVVTNDRAVQYAVKALGAKAIEVGEFMIKGDPGLLKSARPPSAKKQRQDPPKDISLALEDEINKELKSFWLKEKGHKP